MTLDPFSHRGKEWTAVLRPVGSTDIETGLEVVFVPQDGGDEYAWPMGTRLLEAVIEGGVSLDAHRLRKLLRRAIDAGRGPSETDEGAEDGGMLPEVMLSEIRKLLGVGCRR